MWYVIQVKIGDEEEISLQCSRVIDGTVLEKVFIPYREEMKKYGGKWHKKCMPLFPGYVFLISEDPERLFLSLKDVIGLTRLLKTGDEIISLTQDEIDFLLDFGHEEQIVEISTGVIEGDRVRVLKGPLKNREGCIRKIDRHKRKAYITLELMGRTIDTEVGLEIISRTP